MFRTDLSKKRVVGLLLLAAIVILFFSLNRFPKLDAVGSDLDAITTPEVQCFQGFCIERELGSSSLSRWWSVTIAYLRLVALGMIFAFVVAGLAEAFLFPSGSGGGYLSGSTFKRTVTGLAIGPVMNLCSACIVPVSAAFQRRGIGIVGAISMIQGSATMNIPALAMVFFVFSPLLGFSRLFLAIIGATLIGPIVVMSVRKERHDDSWVSLETPELLEESRETDWGPALAEAFRDWVKTSLRYLVHMGPIMVAAAFASGYVLQWISPGTVSEYLGNDVPAVVMAATFGILINVPLLFEIPLVALLLMLGMGTAPAAALLFTAAAGGPITFWGLAKVMPKRAIAAFAGTTWALGAIGGLAVMGIGAAVWDDGDSLRIDTSISSAVAPHALSRAELMALGVQPVTFVDVAAQAGLGFRHSRDDARFNFGGSAAIGDYNGDGLLDMYITNSLGANALYRNNGDGGFTDVAAAAGVDDPRAQGNGAGWGDYDNDGDLDLFVANYGNSVLFRNDGNGSFTDVTSDAGVGDPDDRSRTTGITWGDYDRDGYLDLLVVRHLDDTDFDLRHPRDFAGAVRPLTLYHNNGNGVFTDVTDLLANTDGHPSNVKGAGFKPSFLDYDNDGDSDIYVVNDFGVENYPNVLWRNDGPGEAGRWTFTDVSRGSGTDAAILGMGLAIGDYDSDGDLDLYVTDIGDSEFLENRGDGTFVNVTRRTGTGRGTLTSDLLGDRTPILPGPFESTGWGAAFADLDNDGLLDLYYVAGYQDYNYYLDKPALADPRPGLDARAARITARTYYTPLYQPNALFMNAGDGAFLDVSHLSGADDDGIGREVAYADFNNDGLLDLLVVNMGRLDGSTGALRLFENTSQTGNHWLAIKAVGTTSNRDSMGARIRVTSNGATQIRELGASQGHMSHSLVPAHFGLGGATQADTVEVRWPSGIVQRFTDVPADQVLMVTEP